MLFELKSVFLNDGEEKELTYQLDISDIEIDGAYPFKAPVTVNAAASNRASLVTLRSAAALIISVAATGAVKSAAQCKLRFSLTSLRRLWLMKATTIILKHLIFQLSLMRLSFPTSFCRFLKSFCAARTARDFVPNAAKTLILAIAAATNGKLTQGSRS